MLRSIGKQSVESVESVLTTDNTRVSELDLGWVHPWVVSGSYSFFELVWLRFDT